MHSWKMCNCISFIDHALPYTVVLVCRYSHQVCQPPHPHTHTHTHIQNPEAQTLHTVTPTRGPHIIDVMVVRDHWMLKRLGASRTVAIPSPDWWEGDVLEPLSLAAMLVFSELKLESVSPSARRGRMSKITSPATQKGKGARQQGAHQSGAGWKHLSQE